MFRHQLGGFHEILQQETRLGVRLKVAIIFSPSPPALDTRRGKRSTFRPEWAALDREGDGFCPLKAGSRGGLQTGLMVFRQRAGFSQRGNFHLQCPRPRQPGPRTTRPGLAPVCSPSRSTASPLTNTSRTPVEY